MTKPRKYNKEWPDSTEARRQRKAAFDQRKREQRKAIEANIVSLELTYDALMQGLADGSIVPVVGANSLHANS